MIQLRCPSKDTTSIPRPFDYLPLSSGNKKKWTLANFPSTYKNYMTDSAFNESKKIKLEDALSNNQIIYSDINELLCQQQINNDFVYCDINYIQQQVNQPDIFNTINNNYELNQTSTCQEDTLANIFSNDINEATPPNDIPNINEATPQLNMNVIEQELPPIRPPKSPMLKRMSLDIAPPLPPKNTKSPKKSFFKNLFSPTKKKETKQ